MKKSTFIRLFIILVSYFSNPLFAQDAILKTRTKSNQCNEKSSATPQVDCVVRIRPTDTRISIVFDNTIVSPRDGASGLPTGKRMHEPVTFVISPNDNTIDEVKSSGDWASSQEKVTSKSTTSSGDVSKTSGTPIGGIIVKGGKNPGGSQFNKIVVSDGVFSLPANLEDGEYEMLVSFTYQKIEMDYTDKTSKSYVSGRFILEIEGGECRSIKETGIAVKSTR